ncbi:ArsR/SmtB family transcription factor [Liberiplasma polymorphum]|uniref:ArsR/SmtB family transcription factor n=1 Tax=Liberiplasma polymorphum TaxID=3374570 RepID=UPI003771446A
MKFKYYEHESKLLDLMQLPRLMSIDSQNNSKEEHLEKEEVFSKLNQPLYESMKSLQNKLENYKNEIEMFYASEFLSNYDFFNLITKMYPIKGFKSISDYCDELLKVDKNVLKEAIIYAILSIEDEDEAINNAQKNEAANLVKHQETLLTFVKELPTTHNYKWQLLIMLEDPLNHVMKFKALMEKLEPLYISTFEKHYPYLEDVKNSVIKRLEQNTAESFEALTYHLISSDMLNKEENRLLISLVFPLSFMMKSDLQDDYIIWGIEMEAGFKQVSMNHENRIQKQTQVFKNLSDKTRYEVLRLIASGITSTKDIAERLGVSSATISYHINAFLTTSILKLGKSKHKRYEVDYDKLDEYWKNFINDLTGKNPRAIH